MRNSNLQKNLEQTILFESEDIKSEAFKVTEGKGVNAVIDCVGAEETIRNSVGILSKGGVLVVVGLFGNQIRIPYLVRRGKL